MISSQPFFNSPLPPTVIQIEERDPLIEAAPRVKKIIGVYKVKYPNIFGTFNLNNEKHIFYTIDCLLLEELNIDIVEVFQNDYYSFSMIIAAFFQKKHALDIPKEGEIGRPELYKDADYLAKCAHPLHTIMVMCFAAYRMQKRLGDYDFGQTAAQENYQELKDDFENLACDIINHLNLNGVNGRRQTRIALQVDYKSDYSSTVSKSGTYLEFLQRKFGRSKEIMAIAYKAKAMKFLSQRPCLNLMRLRNESRRTEYVGVDTRKPLATYGIQEISENIWVKMKYKHWFHAIMRMIYIGLFAYMLCQFPTTNKMKFDSSLEIITFGYVFSVISAHVLMVLVKSADFVLFHRHLNSKNKGTNLDIIPLLIRYFKSNRFTTLRFWLSYILIFSELNRFFFFSRNSIEYHIKVVDYENGTHFVETWLEDGLPFFPIFSELLYLMLFSCAAISSIRFFQSIQSLGFFVHIFRKTYKTVGIFIMIFCTFWLVLAVIHVNISRTLLHTDNTLLHTITSPGKFEIFGEVQDEDRVGNLTDCSDYDGNVWEFFEMGYEEASCLVRSTILPFVVFVYIFAIGILLVNLLTAQLTKEYEKESEKSRYYKGYLRYEQLAKIESKLYLPPPLSLFYLLARYIGWFFCCTKTNRFWWRKVVQKMEGYPLHTVHGFENSDKVEKSIKEYLVIEPDNLIDDLKNELTSFQRKPLNLKNLLELRKRVDAFLDDAASQELERMQLRGDEDDDSTIAEEIDVPLPPSRRFTS